ncbi:separase [Sarracenia purpurea var. burkii]
MPKVSLSLSRRHRPVTSMDSDDESYLIEKLQSSDLDINQLISNFLRPFSVHVTEPPNEPTLRSLSKRFLPVLDRALSIIDKRLTETSNLDEQESNAFDDNEKMIVNVDVAALTLAFRTKLYVMVHELIS